MYENNSFQICIYSIFHPPLIERECTQKYFNDHKPEAFQIGILKFRLESD